MTSPSQPENRLLSRNLKVNLTGGIIENASRANDLNQVWVDISERDSDLNIIAYVKPGLNNRVKHEQIRPALEKACEEVFGPEPPEGCIEMWYRDQEEIAQRIGSGLNIEVDGMQGHFDSFDVCIHPPEANFHSVESLKNYFLPAFRRAACGNS